MSLATAAGFALVHSRENSDNHRFTAFFRPPAAGKRQEKKYRLPLVSENPGDPTRIVYVLTNVDGARRISDIRYDGGSSLKKILQADH